MIKIHDYDTPSQKTWHLVIKGIRNSWGSHEKSDSTYNYAYHDAFNAWNDSPEEFIMGDNDKALMIKLIKAGADHGKFMRQLPVIVDITAASYWWWDHDTYKIGTARNSSSSMHTLGKEELTLSHFSFEDIDSIRQREIINTINSLRDEWTAKGKRKGPEVKEWRALIQALPRGFNFSSVWSANYQVLRNMYHARKNHRLSEWRDFCTWIETLPYADLITQQ